MPDHNYFANLIWQIADLLRGPYRPPQYERVMLPRRFDCVLAPTKVKVIAEYDRWKERLKDEALDAKLNKAARPALPQPLPARLREAEGRPGRHRAASRQLHPGLLKERRATLIATAVTGQIDVEDAVA